MSENEDWFESALKDESDGADDGDGDGDRDGDGDADRDGSAFDSGDRASAFEDAEDGPATAETEETPRSGPSDDGAPVDGTADETSAALEDADGSDSTFGDTGESGSAFGDTGEAGSALGDTGEADSAFGDTGEADSAFGDTGAGDAFGGSGGSAGGSESGGGFSGGGEDLFDDSFAGEMGSMGGGSDFEDEDFESDIPRLDLGIEGLDNMIQGGVPLRHLIVIIGGAGTGKTTFGLQFLQHGLEKDDTDKGVFITLEQTYEAIMATADERGWEFARHEEEGNLAVIDLDPIEMANSLDNIRGELPDLIEDFDADRFVLDSVSLLEMMYNDVAKRRTEVFDFTQSLKKAGVTTVLTSEANENNPYASRHGIIEYLTDAVFLLRYVRSETQETRLAVDIQKIRNANHSRETKPYEITMDGISVYEQANIF